VSTLGDRTVSATSNTKRLGGAAWALISLGGFLVIWWLVTDVLRIANAVLLPSPISVVESIVDMSTTGDWFRGGLYGGNLVGNVLISLARVVAGFAISVAAGILLGAVIGTSRTLSDLCEPALELARQVPPISYIPLALIWFGLTEISIVFVIVAGACWPIFLNTVAGMRSTSPMVVRAAQALGCGRWQLISRVYLPSALPQIFTGMRVSFGLAWSAVVAAELIGSSAGIGYLVMHARLIIATPDVIAGMVTIGIIGVIFDAAFVAAERRIFVYRAH